MKYRLDSPAGKAASGQVIASELRDTLASEQSCSSAVYKARGTRVLQDKTAQLGWEDCVEFSPDAQ